MGKIKAAAAVLLLWAMTGFSISGSSFAAPQNDEGVVIPPEAHLKAIEAVKALGPTRGAKNLSYGKWDIIGISRGVLFDKGQLAKAIRDLGARENDMEIQVELSGDVLFDFDKWDIRVEAEETLRKVAGVALAVKSPRVVITGHTDSKGSESYNLTLSRKRADSVKSWLVKNAGVAAGIIETTGYGESRPLAPNTKPDGSDDPQGRQKNRRVEIVVRKSRS